MARVEERKERKGEERRGEKRKGKDKKRKEKKKAGRGRPLEIPRNALLR